MQLIPKTLVQTIGGQYFRNITNITFFYLLQHFRNITNITFFIPFTVQYRNSQEITLHAEEKKNTSIFITCRQKLFVTIYSTLDILQKLSIHVELLFLFYLLQYFSNSQVFKYENINDILHFKGTPSPFCFTLPSVNLLKH